MKNFLLLYLLCFSALGHAQTNVYHPFPENNPVWNFHRFDGVCANPNPPLPGTCESRYSINYEADTVILGLTYHKLTSPLFIDYSCSGTRYDTIYYGAIRQDTAAKKVYFVNWNSSTESLLYDFNLEVGDTIQGYLECDYAGQVDTVVSIDSVLVGNSYHKRWLINAFYSVHIIEGVGSDYGLIEPIPQAIPDMHSFYAFCFSESGQTLYPDTSTSCNLISHTKMLPSTKERQLSVFPNPAIGQFTITVPEVAIRLYVIDMTGRVVLEQPIDGVTTFHVVDSLDPGIYMLMVADAQQNFYRNKIVVLE